MKKYRNTVCYFLHSCFCISDPVVQIVTLLKDSVLNPKTLRVVVSIRSKFSAIIIGVDLSFITMGYLD